MSRIGNKVINLPAKVEVSIDKSNLVKVKGPKGELSRKISDVISLNVSGSDVSLVRQNDNKSTKALHGLYRSLIYNMVVGVSDGFKHNLELVGVGFKASSVGSVLELSLGYSHNIFFLLPEEVKVSTTTEKGQTPKIIMECIDKELLGQMSAKIRSLRKVEPYKGKGVRFVGETIRRKAGKTSAK